MAFLGDNTLENILPDLITPFVRNNLESAHYELTLGEETYLTDSTSGSKDILDDNSIISIEPGQFALLLTNETIKIPENRIGFISIKAGLKFKGLVNISGFHVDPGFEGKLIFSVYNAGPSRILLERGQKCFLIWYSKLDGESNYDGKHNGQKKIPINHIQDLSGKLASPNVLLNRVNKIDGAIEKHWWAIGLIIALFITICFLLYRQYDKYDEGFKDGYSSKQIQLEVQNKVDKLINKKIDSIIKEQAKPKLDSLNKK